MAQGPSDTLIFMQRLDHYAFGLNALKTFKQRYYVNENFIGANSSVDTAILYIGGEGP